MSKEVIINIGNKGNLISVQENNRIVDTLFIDDFNQDTLQPVLDFYAKYKKYDSYIVLDTVAQNYNYKIFPPLNYFDLTKLVSRRFNSEIPRNDLKYKKFLYRNTMDNRSVYLFVSASTDSPLKEWFNLFKTIPNNLIGVFMLPLETVDFAKAILHKAGMKKSASEKNKWILITFNDRTSDLRQVAIFNGHIAFTRLIELDSTGDNLAAFARDDIRRTSEYIKRFDSDFHFDKLTVITILDQANKDGLKDLKMEKTPILNYTPFEIAKELGLGDGSIAEDEHYSDLLINLFIAKNRKRVRLGNRRINTVYNLVYSVKVLKILTVCAILLMFFCFLFYFVNNVIYSSKISNLKKTLQQNKVSLQSKSEEEFGMDSKDVDKIIEAGTLKDMLETKYVDPVSSFEKFGEVQNGISLAYNIKWTLDSFDYQKNVSKDNIKIKIVYDVSILNETGDVNKLFSKYDALNAKLKEVYKTDLVSVSTLPNNINFSQKYLTYPIKIEVKEGN